MVQSPFPLTQMILDMERVPLAQLHATTGETLEAMAKHYRVNPDHAVFYLSEEIRRRAG